MLDSLELSLSEFKSKTACSACVMEKMVRKFRIETGPMGRSEWLSGNYKE